MGFAVALTPNTFASLYWALVTISLQWSLCGKMCFYCVCTSSKNLHKISTILSHTHRRSDLVLTAHLNTCVWQVFSGWGLRNVNKQQQQQLRWLPLNLSYVVIKNRWKRATTVPLTVTRHFSQLNSGEPNFPASACHMSPLLRPLILPVFLRHWPFRAAAQMCDMVSFCRSSDSPSVDRGTQMRVCVCVCVRVLESFYPAVCAASCWLGMILIMASFLHLHLPPPRGKILQSVSIYNSTNLAYAKCLLTRAESAADLNLSLSKKWAISYCSWVWSKTTTRVTECPAPSSTIMSWMKNTSEKTCKQSAMSTLNGDMINLISRRPANKAKKMSCFFFFSSFAINICLPCGSGPAKSFIQFEKFIMLQQHFLTLKSGDHCCCDFTVSLYISTLTSVHPLRVGYSV